jgi:MYXO-CTERM domain-containing protein
MDLFRRRRCRESIDRRRTLMRTFLVVLAAALLAVPVAGAGGFATVGLSSLPPEDGSAWDVELTILQHGRTPLDGLSPAITIQKDDGAPQTFAATPAGKPGVYEATIEFPSDGTWTYTISDGFSQTHTFKPVTIVGAGGSDGSFPWVSTTIAVAAGLALAALLAILARRRRPESRLAASH